MATKAHRLIAVLTLTLLVLGACGFSRSGDTAEDEGPGSYGDPSLLEDGEGGSGQSGEDSQGDSAGGGSGSGSSGGGSGSGSSGGGSTSGGSDFTNRKSFDKWQDFDSLGLAARSILRNDSDFQEIEIRFFFSQGAKPSDAAMGYLRTELKKVIGKKISVDIGGNLPSQSKDFTSSTMRTFTMNERRKANFLSDYPTKLRVWVGYTDNQMQGGGVAGVAFHATSVMIFTETWRNSILTVAPDNIEKVVLLHEVGHLLAMTEIGYRTTRDHRDCEHGNHNRFRNSVMYWLSEDPVGVQELVEGGPLTFDANDRADLAALASGKEKLDPTGQGSC